MAERIAISTDPLTLGDVMAVAEGAEVELADDALERIRRSRGVVDAAIERGDAIYGVTTGVGHARNERLPTEALEALQPFLVELHVGAMGDPLSAREVRAAMVSRLNGFARGGAGVSPEVAQSITAMLNNGVHPIIPSAGSVGSGDLGQLAILGRALMGRGRVWVGDREVDAHDALAQAGIDPVSLKPKDALAIISSNAVTVGRGAFLLRSVSRLLALADLVAATSMDAIRANPSFFDPSVARARSSPGQVETSTHLRDALAGSSRVNETAATSVQDPISFRVVPQVHGACRDVLANSAEVLTDELNAASDNPLVDLDTERILSNGNFHAMSIALSAESLRLALSHVGLLSERRAGQLWDSVISSMGALTAEDDPSVGDSTPAMFAGLSLRYAAAARYTRLRQLAAPVTLDIGSLDLSVEDHSTNAAEAVAATGKAVDVVTDLVVVEALVALARLATDPGGPLGGMTTRLVDEIGDEIGSLPTETMPDETHRRVRDLLDRLLEELV